ncbi:MAG: twin-arginine translocation signal domain-containing protein [Proteobacteria bacterium]|nr:twin-arginine translocation signal domain-containing protein [Pseudomonadota bacterium]
MKSRRDFLKTLCVAGGIGATGGVGAILTPNRAIAQDNKTLPASKVNTFSTEIVLNSRRAVKRGYRGALDDQILSNILWAMTSAPLIGSTRTMYVAMQDGIYLYDPSQHSLSIHKTGNFLSENNLAFEIGVTSDLVEDTGSAILYGHLATTSFWADTSDKPCCCTKGSAAENARATWEVESTIHMANCYGHKRAVFGIVDELVAKSSDSSLPDPSTDGEMLLEDAISNLDYSDKFAPDELTLQELSQIVWASYGCTPHYSEWGPAALTVGSARARYYLSGRIYLVHSQGVETYHHRDPSGQRRTRDHRLETVTDEDRRVELQSAIPELPKTAPNYFVFCADCEEDAEDTEDTEAAECTDEIETYPLLEAGFCGASSLLQATSIGLRGYLTADFDPAERAAIVNALSIPETRQPLLIFSAGHPEGFVDNDTDSDGEKDTSADSDSDTNETDKTDEADVDENDSKSESCGCDSIGSKETSLLNSLIDILTNK